MNAKYIFFLCFAMSYLVIQSVATTNKKDQELELIRDAYITTLIHFTKPKGEKLTVSELQWLLCADAGKTYIIHNNFLPNEVAAWNRDNIDTVQLEGIIRRICENTKQEVVDYMEDINKQLNKKVGIKTFEV